MMALDLSINKYSDVSYEDKEALLKRPKQIADGNISYTAVTNVVYA